MPGLQKVHFKKEYIGNMKQHPLIQTIKTLKGNPRACTFTEPMWGLSMNLCLPYASVFMIGLGLSDTEVGLVASLYMFSQMLFSFLAGVITDKLGRRKTTFIFDFIAWSVPSLIWAFSQGFWFFAVAAVFNGTMKVTTVSWDCLLVEDAPKPLITKLYTLIMIAGSFSALFAPISSILVSKLTLIPAIRILYINAFVIMTLKIWLLYRFSTETAAGVIRMKETKGKSLVALSGGYGTVLLEMLRSKATLFAIVISIIVEIIAMLHTTFWQVIASKRIGVSDTMLPIFPMISSMLAILFYFTIIGHMDQRKLKKPLIQGFFYTILSSLILIMIVPNRGWTYLVLLVSLGFQSLGSGLLAVLRESIVAIHVDAHERSRVMAILHMVVMLVSVPFGYIGGFLSDQNKAFPFVLVMVLGVAGILVALLYREKEPKKAVL
jgi:MFS family permease